MKIGSRYRLREMAGEHVVVIPAPRGGADFTRIVSLNASALCLWEALQGHDFSPEEAAGILEKRYEVDPDVARRDAREWIGKLAECGIIEE